MKCDPKDISDSISWCTDIRFNIDFEIWKKSSKDIRVIIESKIEIKLPNCRSGLIYAQVQFQGRDNLLKYQCDF